MCGLWYDLCVCYQGPFVLVDKLVDHMLNLQLPDGETLMSAVITLICAGTVQYGVPAPTGWSKKNGATLHFPKYLENY